MFNLIKQIFQKNKNAYVVVVENEKPVLVIESFEEYQRILGGNLEHKKAGEDKNDDKAVRAVENPTDDLFDFTGSEDELESLNREIMNLQTPLEPEVETPSSQREMGNAGVEDIPVI